MRTTARLAFYTAVCISCCVTAAAQSLPVGTPVLEDYYRRAQLMGEIDSAVSFTIRPLYPVHSFAVKDPFYPDVQSTGRDTARVNYWKGTYRVLPISADQLYNSTVPTGWNDEAFIPAKGYQARISAGFYAQFGPLSIQARPELITSPNKDYEGFPSIYPDFEWARYYYYIHNLIDKPERFGEHSYSKLLPGQSSVSLTFKSVAVGLSTENLWWGPGQYNSLLMSNTAEGFYHLSFNTVKPVTTPVGSFELQAIAGRLEDSGYTPPEPDRTFNGLPLYTPRNTSWRYLSGIITTWHPKWVDGLFLGYARTLQAYHQELGRSFEIPFLLPFQKFMAHDDSTLAKYDQYYSVFGRWLLPAAHGEVYFEYGRNNHPYLYENYPVTSAHSRAYVAGIKKLLPLKNGTDQVQVNIELTELNSPADYLSKPGESWYVNKVVRQGYTNKGKLLGAGIGPGGSLQTLDVSWFRKMNRVGLQLERYLHDNDLYYFFFANTQDVRRHWVDVSATANLQLSYKRFLFNSSIAAVQSLNYQYYLKHELQEVPFAKGHEIVNLHAQLGVSCRF